MDIVEKLYTFLNSDKYLSAIVSTFLVVYGSTAAPELPSIIKILFSNPVFKIIFLGLLGYSVNQDPKLSILLAIILTITLNIIRKYNFLEEPSNYKKKILKNA